jgi:phosphoribosylanthranilate isomerase
MTHVKICGCMRVEDALAAAEAGADFVGLVFAESRRRLEPDEASDIVRALGEPLSHRELLDPPSLHRDQTAEGTPIAIDEWFRQGAAALERLLERKRPLTVGVFAGQSLDVVNAIADECGLDLMQLSGGEPWQDCLLITRQVIKVVHVQQGTAARDVLGRIEAVTAVACLLDTASEAVYGGSGRIMDWTVARDVAAQVPIVLAGGLTPENVEEAVRVVRPWGVDVSTGVETGGAKDAAKIRAFVQAAKGASRVRRA